MIVQAVIFNNKQWLASEARKWLKDNGFTPIKPVHRTIHFLRFRIREPDQFSGFITKKLHNGIELIIGKN